jgi:hypothetical protein
MKLKLAVGAVAVAAAFGAQAGTIILDDFSLVQNAVFTSGTTLQTSGASGTVSQYVNSRTLNITGVAGNSPASNGSYVQVLGGVLEISNGVASASRVDVSWNLNATALSAALANATFFQIIVRQVSLDSGTVTVGGSARTNSTNGQNIVLASASSLVGLNPFTTTFSSTNNADSTWEFVGLEFSCRAGASSINDADRNGGACTPATNVPLPGTVALLGLGLLGAGALRRKAK